MTRSYITICCVALLSGCAEERPSIRLELDTDGPVPGALDTFLLEVVAENDQQRYCEMSRMVLHVSGSSDLPVRIKLERGEIYDQGVFYRVTGYIAVDQHDLEQTTTAYEGYIRWPPEDFLDEQVVISQRCFLNNEPECGDDEQCYGDGCEPLPLDTMSETSDRTDTGVSCDSALDSFTE